MRGIMQYKTVQMELIYSANKSWQINNILLSNTLIRTHNRQENFQVQAVEKHEQRSFGKFEPLWGWDGNESPSEGFAPGQVSELPRAFVSSCIENQSGIKIKSFHGIVKRSILYQLSQNSLILISL